MKNTQWIIQSSGLHDSEFKRTAETLTALGYNFTDFGMIPFTNNITNLEKIQDKNLIARTGTKFINLASGEGFTDIGNKPIDKARFFNSIDYSRYRFDQQYYNKLGLPLLNSDTKLFKYSDIKDVEFHDSYFFKPTNDLKAFNATVVYAGDTLDRTIKAGMYQKFNEKNETVLMTTLKHVEVEYRFFVVKGEIVTGSQYYKNGELDKLPYEMIPTDIRNIADKYAKLYIPRPIFVMDLCIHDDEVKIVEYNCWNASGFYDSDLFKLFEAVQEYKEKL